MPEGVGYTTGRYVPPTGEDQIRPTGGAGDQRGSTGGQRGRSFQRRSRPRPRPRQSRGGARNVGRYNQYNRGRPVNADVQAEAISTARPTRGGGAGRPPERRMPERPPQRTQPTATTGTGNLRDQGQVGGNMDPERRPRTTDLRVDQTVDRTGGGAGSRTTNRRR